MAENMERVDGKRESSMVRRMQTDDAKVEPKELGRQVIQAIR